MYVFYSVFFMWRMGWLGYGFEVGYPDVLDRAVFNEDQVTRIMRLCRGLCYGGYPDRYVHYQTRLRYASGITVMLLTVMSLQQCFVPTHTITHFVTSTSNCNLNLIVSLLIPICYP